MHPHGVKYNPEYDGVYLGRLHPRRRLHRAPARSSPTRGRRRPTRSASGPTTTTGPTTRSTPSAGCSARSSSARRARRSPTSSTSLFLHPLAPPVTGLERQFQCINGRAFAGNTPTLRAKVGQDVAFHVIGMDYNFHDFHIHGHRWKDPSRGVRRHPGRRAQRDDHRPLHRGQPGPLAVPLPRLHPPGRWDGGLVPGRALRHRRRTRSHDAGPHHRPGRWSAALALAAAAHAPATTRRRPSRRRPRRRRRARSTRSPCASKRLQVPDDPVGGRRGQGRRHGQGQAAAPTTRA